MNSSISVRNMLDRLRAEGLVPADSGSLRVLSVQPPTVPPWYVRVFAGMGAWVAALLVLAFLVIVGALRSETTALILGIGACGVAVAFSRVRERGDFLSQLALSLSLLGQSLVTVGMFMLLQAAVPVALAVIVLELVLIGVYADQFHRFLSGLAIVGALLVILADGQQFDLIHGLLLGLALLAATVSVYEYALLSTDWWEVVHPLRYAAVVALLGLLVLPLQTEFAVIWWWFSALGLEAVLAGVIWLIARDLGVIWRRDWLLVGLAMGVGIAVLGIKMPGVVAALLVLVLGFWRSNRTLMGLAAAFLLFYLGAYYYSVQLTLLSKSLAMLGAGGMLLGLRWVAARLNRQGAEQ